MTNLYNRRILEKFVDGALGIEDGEDEEEVAMEKKERIRQRRRNADEDDEDANAAFDPEEAYLKINANLRNAFKKQHQLPLVSEDARSYAIMIQMYSWKVRGSETWGYAIRSEARQQLSYPPPLNMCERALFCITG